VSDTSEHGSRRAGPAIAGLLCSALAAISPTSAPARDLWTGDDGKSVLELRGFYKPFGAIMLVPDGLVQGTEALQSLMDLARASLPPAQAALIPASIAIPREVGMSTHTLRLWGKLVLGERFELDAGWQAAVTTASEALVSGGSTLGGAIPYGGATDLSGRRLVDFDPVLAQTSGFLLQHDLDLLSARVALPMGQIVAGRQILSWGTGHFWNPTDLLSPFAPTDVDKEVRHGVDALRFSAPLGKTSLVDLMWLPQKHGADQGGVARVQANLMGFDFSASAAKYVSDVVFGADTAGDLGALAVHAEATYTLGLTGLDAEGPVKVHERFFRAVAGVEWKPASDLYLDGEYYFNGFGTSDPAQYVAKLHSPREQTGEIFGAGRHYLGLGAIWKSTDLLTLNGTVIVNIQDPSAIALPVAEYWFEQSVIVRVGGYVPVGRPPDPRALQGLTLQDMVAQSRAWTDATSSFGLRSEYGASPFGLFAQVGIYF
jgi:hypothetical protein